MSKNYKPISLILLAGVLCFSQSMYAEEAPVKQNVNVSQQNGKVTGIVEDDLGPVPGASVVVKGTTNGNITDMDGKFTLEGVKKGAILQISFIGYATQEIPASDGIIKVHLVEDSQALQEVVVTGFGGIQKAKTLTAAATVVKVDQIAKLPVMSISEGLGGRVTGVITQQSSGAPGQTAKIWIRGGSKILYVIDDVVMETEQGEIFFNRMRPEDIAAMTILKDASATAIYGPRAQDGVVVINTKRGQEGSISITFDERVSILTPSYRPKVMSAWDYANARNDIYAANYEENPAFNTQEMSYYYMGHLNQLGKNRQDIMGLVNNKYNTSYSLDQINDLFNPYKTSRNIQDYYQTYDPWDFFNNVQPMTQTSISMRGGSDRVKYYSSLSYMDRNGLSKSYNYDQYNVILNTDAFMLKDKSLKFSLNMNGSMANKLQPYVGEGVYNNAMYGDWMPNRPAIWSTGLPRAGAVDADLNTGFDNNNDYRLQTSMILKWSLPWIQGLAVQASVNYNMSYNMGKKFGYDQQDVYGSPSQTAPNTYNSENASLTQSWGNYKLTTGVLQAEYNNTFGKHHVSAMINYQSQIRNTNSTSVTRYDYASIYVPQINAAAKYRESSGSEVNWGSASYVGRVSYDYEGKYLIQYNGNYNASLSYSPDKRWGYFQAVSAGWIISEESFFKKLVNPKIVNMLKIRAGYGLVGDEIGNPFDYINQYKQSDTKILLGENAVPNVGWYEYQRASDLTWSGSKQMSAGIDFGLLNNRLNGSFDVYLYKNNGDAMNMSEELIRTDILGMPNIPQINAPFETSRKGGYEFSLNWNDQIDQVGYRLGVNFSHWDKRTTRHTDAQTYYYYRNTSGLGLRDMQPVYSIARTSNGLYGSYMDMYNGVLANNINLGTFRMVDVNGDGVINSGDNYWQNRAGTVPLTQYGVTLGLSYKGFDFEAFVQGATDVTGSVPSPLRSQQSYMWNYGQYAYLNSYLPGKNNTDAALPLPVSEGNGWGYNNVDRWIFDASYVKLKNLSLAYDLKQKVLKNVSTIKGLNVNFVVTNVFTWTKKSYPLKGLQDPEFITSGASIYNSNGTLGSYPTQRQFTLGLTLTL